jgi:hypothetical protein
MTPPMRTMAGNGTQSVILVIALGAALQGQTTDAQTRSAMAPGHLVPFRDPGQATWGYKRLDGRVAIPARYLGAGLFREGQAPVKDRAGFAMIDDTGRVVRRIVTNSVSPSAVPIPSPADACAWSATASFPSTGLQCYIRQLRGSAAVIGGDITITPSGGESSHAALILQLPNGVVVVEDIRYEGFTRRVLLPGVSHDEALQWRRTLHPDLPAKDGCSESWHSGVLPGGAFIEQAAGC